MKVFISLPVPAHIGFLGRCRLNSREYAILRNGIVTSGVERPRVIEIFCTMEDAELLLDHATRYYPTAVPYLRDAIHRALMGGGGAAVPGADYSEFRKSRFEMTWHMCLNCTLWPTQDFISVTQFPPGAELCNECRARDPMGECTRSKNDTNV